MTVTQTINKLRLVSINVADNLTGYDTGSKSVIFANAKRFEDSFARCACFSLATGMHFEQPIQALDNLHTWSDRCGFQGNIGNSIDLNSGRDFNPQ
jgi:hypothetical protein